MANSSDYYYDKGLNFLNEENYEEALMYLDKAIDMEPNNLEYLNSKAICLYNLNSVDESIEYFDKVLEINPDNESAKTKKAELLAIKANEYFEDNDFDKSVEIWNNVILLNNKNADYLNSKAIALSKPLLQEDTFDDINIAPRRVKNTFIKEIDALIKSKSYEYALEAIDDAITYDSTFAPFWFKKGTVLRMTKKFDEAIECYDKVLELDSEPEKEINKAKMETYFLQGKYLTDNCQYDAAIECYDKAIHIDSNFVACWSAKAYCASMLLQNELALECYDYLIENLNNQQSIPSKIFELRKLKRYDEAMECIDEMDEDMLEKHILKLLLLIELNKFAQAKRYINSNIDDENEKNRLIELTSNIQQLTEAIDCIDEAIKIDKDNISFLDNKKICLYNKAKYLAGLYIMVGVEAIDELIKIDPNNAKYWTLKGNLLFNMKSPDQLHKSRECINKASKLIEGNQ